MNRFMLQYEGLAKAGPLSAPHQVRVAFLPSAASPIALHLVA